MLKFHFVIEEKKNEMNQIVVQQHVVGLMWPLNTNKVDGAADKQDVRHISYIPPSERSKLPVPVYMEPKCLSACK